jgi:hypothetical protein
MGVENCRCRARSGTRRLAENPKSERGLQKSELTAKNAKITKKYAGLHVLFTLCGKFNFGAGELGWLSEAI